MLEVNLLGHASLLVKGAGTILCDPIFGDEVSGGGNLIDPLRRIVIGELGPIDAVAITHHHSDHFDPGELARLPELRARPFLVPAGSIVAARLTELGYREVIELRAGDRRRVGGVEITATPSHVPFPEIGFLFEHDGAAALNLADTIFHESLGMLRELAPRPGLVLAPFQAGGYMSLLPLRVGGPPNGLVAAIRRWSEEYLEELTEDVATLAPRHVVPFADGIRYRDARINRWHFPLPDEAFSEALAAFGIASSEAIPGNQYLVHHDRVELSPGSAAVVEVKGRAAERRFDPTCRLSDQPLPCRGGQPGNAVISAAQRTQMTDNLARVLALAADAAEREQLRALCEQWRLELCDVAAPAVRCWRIDTAQNPPLVRSCAADEPESSYGIRANWCDLARVLAGEIPLEFIELSGALRYFSPEKVNDLESIRSRVLHPLRALFAAHA